MDHPGSRPTGRMPRWLGGVSWQRDLRLPAVLLVIQLAGAAATVAGHHSATKHLRRRASEERLQMARRAWVVLMKRLGYTQFASQGGDWGGAISNVMGHQAPTELLGIHVNFPGTVPPDVARAPQCGDPPPAGLSADERRAYEQLNTLYTKRRAYSSMMGTRPQTLTGIADSPVGLAAWLLDHGDSYGQPAAPVTSAVLGHTANGHPAGDLTRDDVLDNITPYWLTNTAISAARLYWENKLGLYNDADVSVPAAVSAFPGEGYQAPRSWTERAYHNLMYYNQPDRGGHFAAWEEPELFATEIRAAFKSLR